MRLTVDLDHFRARVLQDALTEGLAATWTRRAAMFEWAAPRPGDFTGRATAEELTAARVRCLTTAAACRRHAALILDGRPEPISSDVWTVLAEVA